MRLWLKLVSSDDKIPIDTSLHESIGVLKTKMHYLGAHAPHLSQLLVHTRCDYIPDSATVGDCGISDDDTVFETREDYRAPYFYLVSF
jgi:hypothetical protein